MRTVWPAIALILAVVGLCSVVRDSVVGGESCHSLGDLATRRRERSATVSTGSLVKESLIPEAGFLIRGLVLSARDGQPIVGARVRLGSGEKQVGFRTAGDGKYSGVLPEGFFAGTMARRHMARISFEADGHLGFDWIVELDPALAERVAPTVALRSVSALITGRVVDAEGRPISGATVQVGTDEFRDEPRDWITAPATTGQDGRYGPLAVGSGWFELVAWAPGQMGERFDLSIVHASPPGTRTVDFCLAPSARYRGAVVDVRGRPVAGAEISQFCSLRGREITVLADDGGRFEWDVVEARGNAVHVSAGDAFALVASFSLRADQESRIVLRRASSIEGETGGPGRRADPPIRREPARKPIEVPVTIRVVDESGCAISGALVRTGRGWHRGTATDAHGTARVRLGAGLEWPIRASHPAIGEACRSLTVRTPPADYSVILVLRPLPEDMLIRVVDETGLPLPDAVLGHSGRAWRADAEGLIRTTRWRGEPRIVTAPGHGKMWLDGQAAKDAETGVHRIVLCRTATLTGRVVGPGGEPVAGVIVSVDTWGGDRVTSDGAGRFCIPDLAPGRPVSLTARGRLPFESSPFDTVRGVPGGPPVLLRWQGRGEIRVSGVDPSRHEDVCCRVFLPQRRDEDGAPFDAGVRPRSIGKSLLLTVPAGEIGLTLTIPPDGKIVYPALHVEPGGRSELVYRYPGPGGLTGLITDRAGRPVPGALIREALTRRCLGETDENGVIQVGDEIFLGPREAGQDPAPLLTGRTRLLIRARGFAPAVTEIVDLAARPDISCQLAREIQSHPTILK
jgi:hypothetical protein